MQVHHVTTKAAELQRMFAPMTKLGEARKILPYNYTVGSAGQQTPGRAVVPQRHYSSPSAMLTEARTRSGSQPPMPKPMIFELESEATSSEVTESVTSDTATEAGDIESRESTTAQFDIPQGCLWDPPQLLSKKSHLEQKDCSSQPALIESAEHNHHHKVDDSAATPSPTGSTSDYVPPPHSDEKSGRTMSGAFTAARSIMPTPSVFRRNRNKTDSAAWLRRSHMFGTGQ